MSATGKTTNTMGNKSSNSSNTSNSTLNLRFAKTEECKEQRNNTNTEDIGLQRLTVPYFMNKQGELKTPWHLVTYWRKIFSFVGPNSAQILFLRWMCRLFRDSLLNVPSFSYYPNNIDTNLRKCLTRLSSEYIHRRTKEPDVLFIGPGTHVVPLESNSNRLTIGFPVVLCGESAKTTTIRCGFRIRGSKLKSKAYVTFQGLTLSNSTHDGVFACNGLPTNLSECIVKKSAWNGVSATSAVITMNNTVIKNNKRSGLFVQTQYGGCEGSALLRGAGTHIHHNCTGKLKKDSGRSAGSHEAVTGCYGIEVWSHACVRLERPLVLTAVSTDHKNGRDCGGGGDIITMLSLPKEQNKTWQHRQYTSESVLDQIQAIDGNNACADCQSRQQVTWASLTYGTLLCIHCSGHHRNYGTHISFVKSIDLDYWTSKELDRMLIHDSDLGGNAAFRNYMTKNDILLGRNSSNTYKSDVCQSYREAFELRCSVGLLPPPPTLLVDESRKRRNRKRLSSVMKARETC